MEPKPTYTIASGGNTESPLRPVMAPTSFRSDKLEGYDLWAKNEALRLFSAFGHWDQVAQALSQYLALSGASWWQVAQGQRITEAKINALRAYNGLAPLPVPQLVRPCVTCGDVHVAGDCHGAPVAQVVCLTPEQRVTKKRIARPVTKWRDLPKDELARIITGREAYAGV